MRALHKAVFLDRDGVLCRERSYITMVDQLEILPYTVDAMKALRNAGWKTFVITNQSAVAKGLMTEPELDRIHQQMLSMIPLDDIYYCPHYPPESETKPPYFVECNCRKPKPGMILRAAKEHGIDLYRSFMVGDRGIDVLAGKNAGVKTVLLKTGYNESGLEEHVGPDFIFKDLKDFCGYLINRQENDDLT